MEYGIQALAGIGMVFAVITDLWQKKSCSVCYLYDYNSIAFYAIL